MTPRQAASLVLLAAILGTSFLFIRIAVEELGPAALTEARVLLAAAVVAAYVLLLRGALGLRERSRDYLVLGTFAAALPFGLIAAAELELPASLASILNATPPIWAAVIAALLFGERFTARLAGGLALALGGVALVVAWRPLTLMFLSSLRPWRCSPPARSTARWGTSSARRMRGVAPLSLVAGQHAAAAVVLLPVVALVPVREAPEVGEWGAVLALGLVCTALAFVLYFRLIAEVGATRTLTVTFLVPVFGVLWGALFLGEELRPAQGVGALVLLAGVRLVVAR